MKPGLIINEEPMDEIHDFLNYSLSDACFSIGKRVIPHVNSENSFSQESPSNIISPKQQTSIQKSQRFLIDQNQVTEQSDGKNNSIIQSFMLKKFIQKLSWKKKLNANFNKYHYDVINDKGSNFNLRIFKQNTINLKPLRQKRTERIQEHECYKTIIEIAQITIIKIQAILDKIPIIYPEYKLKIIWDLLALVARLYFMFGIPLDLAWTLHQYLTGRVLTTTIFFMLVLICDILVSFNTAIYEYGQAVTQRSKIAFNVISKSYGFEFSSVFVLLFYLLYILAKEDEFNVNQNWYYIFLVTFLIQYRNITKYTEQIEEVLNLSKPVSCLLELLKLMLLLFFGLHLFACLWFWIGDYSVESGKSWLIAKSLENEQWDVQYLYSIYFSAVTMFTVGYGDVTPQNQIETIVCILFMVICSIQLSYSVNTVGAMIDKISYYNKEKMKKVQTINTYMQNKKISYELRFQIREYLNYFWQSSNQEETQEEKELINQLSENLREKLIFEANSQILLNCPLFKYHFSDQLKKKLVKKIKQVYVQPENIIDFDKEKKRDIFIMFIEEGSIQIFIENELQKGNLNQVDVSVVSTINQGASLGVLSFLTELPASERFRSVGFTKLLILSREDFLNIIPEFPEDYELFREMHDDLIYNSDSKFLKLSCFSCKRQSHRAIECPMLHFIPDREYIIKKHQYNRDQQRNEHTKGQAYLRNPFRQKSSISWKQFKRQQNKFLNVLDGNFQLYKKKYYTYILLKKSTRMKQTTMLEYIKPIKVNDKDKAKEQQPINADINEIEPERQIKYSHVAVQLEEEEIDEGNQNDFADLMPEWTSPGISRDKQLKLHGTSEADPTTLYLPEKEIKKLTKVMRQYWRVKSDNFDKVVFFQIGKFYELYYEDAVIGNKYLDLNWVKFNGRNTRFPEKFLNQYSKMLVDLGFKVAVVDQTEIPELMAKRIENNKGLSYANKVIVERELTQLFTKGSYLYEDGEEQPLDDRFILAIRKDIIDYKNSIEEYGIAMLERQTNQITLNYIQCTDDSFNELKTFLLQIKPIEVIIDPMNISFNDPIYRMIQSQVINSVITTVMAKNNNWDHRNTMRKIQKIKGEENLPQPILHFKEAFIVNQALSGLITFLEQILIFERVMGCATFKVYDIQYSLQSKMIMDSQALQHLEILQPLNPLMSKKDYSLFAVIDKTSTPGGHRLLRQWLCAPLYNLDQINERQLAVQDMSANKKERDQIKQVFKLYPDFQRTCNRLYEYSIKASQRAMFNEDISKTKLKQFKKIIIKFREAYNDVLRIGDNGNLFKSRRLRILTNQDILTIQGQQAQLPNINQYLDEFDKYMDWEENILKPKRGTNIAYDKLSDQIQEIKEKFEQYISIYRKLFKDDKNVKFSHTKVLSIRIKI